MKCPICKGKGEIINPKKKLDKRGMAQTLIKAGFSYRQVAKFLDYKSTYSIINLIKQNHTQYELVVAPGPGEIEEAKSFNIRVALSNNLALDFFELASLIKKSHLVIANDTGPAHMAAHLGAKGFALFGPHTTPEKVSIEREKFIALQTTDLKSLFADRVYALIKSSILS